MKRNPVRMPFVFAFAPPADSAGIHLQRCTAASLNTGGVYACGSDYGVGFGERGVSCYGSRRAPARGRDVFQVLCNGTAILDNLGNDVRRRQRSNGSTHFQIEYSTHSDRRSSPPSLCVQLRVNASR